MKNKKGYVAPIIATVIFVLYYVMYFALLMFALDGILRILLGLIPLGFAAVMIYVCVERLREIKKGDDNDLSQY